MDNDTNQIILPPDTPPTNKPASMKTNDDEQLVAGNEPMTAPQHEILSTLMELHGEQLDDNLTKTQATELIDAKKQNISVSDSGEVPDGLWDTGNDPGKTESGKQ